MRGNDFWGVPKEINYKKQISGKDYSVQIFPRIEETVAGDRLSVGITLSEVLGNKVKKRFDFSSFSFKKDLVLDLETIFNEDFSVSMNCSYKHFINYVSRKYNLRGDIINNLFYEQWEKLSNYRNNFFNAENEKFLQNTK